MKRLLIAAVALSALAVDTDFSFTSFNFSFTTSANAAEMEKARPRARRAAPAARPAQAPASNWTGGQAGGQGGGSSGTQSFVDPPYICPGLTFGASCFASPFSFSGTPGSFTGGGFLGYRWQMGGMVVGVESDVSWKKLETTYSQATGPSVFVGGTRTEFFHGSVKQTWDASFRVRGGYLVTPWTLAYVTGGLAVGEVSGSFDYRGTLTTLCGLVSCTATVSSSWNETRVGGTVGAGVETAIGGLGKSPFGGGVKLRLEYRYTDFGKYSKSLAVSSNCLAGVCTAPTSTNVDISAAFHKVTAGIGFDF